MRILGIDYGSKRVGVAISDESGKFALPHSVILNPKNNTKLIDLLNEIICAQEVSTIIIGESKDFDMKDNKIMADIKIFKEDLENRVTMPVIFELEFLTSHQAQKLQGKNDMLDASAAALILQSYLDRMNASADSDSDKN